MIEVYIGEEKKLIDYKKIKKIYIQGICGTAMSAVAKILLDDGKEVYGADNNFYSPVKDLLQSLNIKLLNGLKEENLKEAPELVIVGNIMSKDHPESIAIRKMKIPFTSFPELFKNYYLKGKIPIVIAGTNGKTTTTSLISFSLEYLKEDPSFFIGGIPLNSGLNGKLGKGKYFVLEGDEYETAYFEKTPKFFHFNPFFSIITSFSYDHIDFFPSFEDYLKAFLKFSDTVKEKIFISSNCKKLIKKLKKEKILRYGFSKKDDLYISKIIKKSINGTSFEAILFGKEKITIETKLIGEQNVENFAGAFLLLIYLNFKKDEILKSFLNFKGVKRRQEILYNKDEIILIDDFAHHPEAVYKTLKGIKKNLRDYKIISIFEPRTNTSRTSFFEKEYVNSFNYSDKIIILPPPPPKGKFEPLNLENLKKGLEKKGKEVYIFFELSEILDYISKTLKPKTAIVFLSNGPMDDLQKRILTLFV